MSMTDPIADMLTRIRNATVRKHEAVDMPRSNIKKAVAEALKREGYIRDLREAEEGVQGLLRVYLKYDRDGNCAIRFIRRDSTPGRRVYRKVDNIEPVLDGMGISILSTPKGVLSDRECREQRIGGELLCTVW